MFKSEGIYVSLSPWKDGTLGFGFYKWAMEMMIILTLLLIKINRSIIYKFL